MDCLILILKWVSPYIIKLVEKYLPEITDELIEKIKEKRRNAKMASLIITVKNTEGTVLEGVTIGYAIAGVGTSTKTTDTNGQATISGLTAGNYALTAALDGYTSNTITVEATEESTTSETITLTAEETTESNTDILKDTAKAVVETVGITAEAAAEQNLHTQLDTALSNFVTKEQKEIATTKSSYVKVRDQLYITLVTAAEAELDAQISVLGVKALAQLEKLIAKF